MAQEKHEAGTCSQQARPQIETTSRQFSYPAPGSVKGRVLGALLRDERLTHWDCWRRFASARLAHHIHVLRRYGWPVQMVETTVQTSDAGRAATIGEYFLSADLINEAGENGQRFAAICANVERERQMA
jgi:hypothetical protein